MMQVWFYNKDWILFDMIIFSLSLIFVILPMIRSIIELEKGIKEWRHDTDNGTSIESWLSDNLRSLYFLIALNGGSTFSTIIICNSNYMGLKLFDMSLTKRQQRVFRNKRVFSVVILENLPQLILQMIFSLNYGGWSEITIFATFFSIISIFITIFEYFTQRLLIQTEMYVVLSFIVKSDHISRLSHSKFRKIIQNNRLSVQRGLAKIIQIGPESIELLKPIQIKDGTILIFHIQTEKLDGRIVEQLLEPEIKNRNLQRTLKKCWDVQQVNQKFKIYNIETKKIYPEKDDRGNANKSIGVDIKMKSSRNAANLSTTTSVSMINMQSRSLIPTPGQGARSFQEQELAEGQVEISAQGATQTQYTMPTNTMMKSTAM